MKHFIITLFALAVVTTIFAQDNPNPTKSRFWKSKESTFTIKPGDILVYRVEPAEGEGYDLLVHVKQYGSSINFDYDMPTKGKKANVNVQTAAVSNGISYSTAFNNADVANRNVWLSKKNYREIAGEGETDMDFGNGTQKFTKANTGTLKINYKGKPKILTLYNINNVDGAKNNVGVMNDEKNPLMLTLDNGIRMTLKEVR